MRLRATCLASLIAACLSAPITVARAAELPTVEEPSAETFSFRKVRPPRAGARKRIILSDTPTPARRQTYDWFWRQTDVRRISADPARLGVAVEAFTPRLAKGWPVLGGSRRARALAAEVAEAIEPAATAHRISPALLLAVIGVESAGRQRAVSPKGAQGLMQLMPGTAKRFGVSNPFDPVENVDGGAAYLSLLLDMFQGDAILALAAYNAGEGAVMRHKGVPPYAETRDYVAKVIGAFAGIRSLCVAPPVGPRDPCVLRESS